MTGIGRRGILALMLALGAFPGWVAAQESPRDVRDIPRIVPRINAPLPGYPAGDPVTIILELHNPSRSPVTLEEDCLRPSAFRVRAAGSATATRARRNKGEGPLTVPPGRTVRRPYDLRRHFKILRKPGHYWASWSCGERESSVQHIYIVEPYDSQRDRVAVLHTGLGTMELVLMPEQAPLHVRTFVQLARQGYYDGLSFNKMIPGIQVVSSDRSETVASRWDQQLPAEIDESILPGKGLVGAVRRESSMTSATRFFILLDTVPMMAGKQTWFAYVRKGGEVLEAFKDREVIAEAGGSAWRLREPVKIEKIEILPE